MAPTNLASEMDGGTYMPRDKKQKSAKVKAVSAS